MGCADHLPPLDLPPQPPPHYHHHHHHPSTHAGRDGRTARGNGVDPHLAQRIAVLAGLGAGMRALYSRDLCPHTPSFTPHCAHSRIHTRVSHSYDSHSRMHTLRLAQRPQLLTQLGADVSALPCRYHTPASTPYPAHPLTHSRHLFTPFLLHHRLSARMCPSSSTLPRPSTPISPALFHAHSSCTAG